MKIYLMTDVEAVAGVMNFRDWCRPESRYYDLAKELLTREVNAAIDGFFAGGATRIMVADGHGCGAINPVLLDPRVELLRGWPDGYPLLLDDSFDAVAWVGQHAMSRTELSHLTHTGDFSVFEMRINGRPIGEIGQFGLCATEMGIPCILLTGEQAACREAEDLFPGIETVAVKRGVTLGRGDECTAEQYMDRNTAVITRQPEKARELIRQGAERAARRAQNEKFGLAELSAPYEIETIMRPGNDHPTPRRSIRRHATRFAAAMNEPYVFEPCAAEG
jgi:D-amino peptidase